MLLLFSHLCINSLAFLAQAEAVNGAEEKMDAGDDDVNEDALLADTEATDKSTHDWNNGVW